MIYFNGEPPMLEKYASPLVTFVILFSITGYVLLINYLVPGCGYFLR